MPIIISLIVGYYCMGKGESVGEFTMRTSLNDYPLILLLVPIAGIVIMLIILYEALWCIKIKQWRK
jgi:hypothetical protein